MGAGYNRKFESTADPCCDVVTDFTDFTIHTEAYVIANIILVNFKLSVTLFIC